MIKIKRNKSKDYTTISNVFLKDKELSFSAKGFLAVVMGLPDDWDFSIEGMLAISKEGEFAVRSIVKELSQAGYCNCYTDRTPGGRIKSWVYQFSEDVNEEWKAIANSEHSTPLRNLPQVDKPNVVLPQVGNSGQLNTNSNKELNNKTKHKEKEEEILLPFHSERFVELWSVLMKMPNWKKKPVSALQMSLKKVSEFDEEFVITLMEDAIAGNWKGLVFADTADSYEAWKKSRTTSTAKSKEITMEDLK